MLSNLPNLGPSIIIGLSGEEKEEVEEGAGQVQYRSADARKVVCLN